MYLSSLTTFLLAALVCLVCSEETTTNLPDATATDDYNGTTLFDYSTTDSEKTEPTVELSTTEGEASLDTTTYWEATDNQTDGTPTRQDEWTTTTFIGDGYSNEETTTILDQSTATEINELLNVLEEGNSEEPKERKPVVEPPFIKKYWPLLCLKTKCGIRLASVPVPDHKSKEVRTDLEESRSSSDVLRGIMDDIIIDSEPKESADSSLYQ